MKQKKEKTEHIVSCNDESSETLFEKIKDWEITSQLNFAVSFDNLKRKELFNEIIKNATIELIKQNIILIVKRIEQAAFPITGYTHSEIEYYQSLYAKEFLYILHTDNYQTYIEDKIRELHFNCKNLEQHLKINQYEYFDFRELDIKKLTECERYKVYLENLFSHINNSTPQITETRTNKLKVKQIALLHIYEGNQITRDNADEIAAKYGYNSKTSGEGLFQDYIFYSSSGNRKQKPSHCTPKTLLNKIELFESVLKILSDKCKQRAIDEINILKTIYQNEYQ
jgi:hypothetical protein